MNKKGKIKFLIFSKYKILCLLILLLSQKLVVAQEDIGYQLPPEEIVNLIDAPPTPSVRIDPKGQWILLLERPSLPTIEELVQPELRLAGLRINPKTNAKSRSYYYIGLSLLSIGERYTKQIKGLPPNPKIKSVLWSPDSEKIAFTITKEDGIELWIAYVKNFQAKNLTKAVINDALYGEPYCWLSNSKGLIYKSIIDDRPEPPQKPIIPTGPVINENVDKKAPVRTYQDLLKNAYDEELFEYYMSSKLMSVDLKGRSKSLGATGMIESFDISPDGTYLLVQTIHRPFSHIVPWYRFSTLVEIWDINGSRVKQIADLPLAEDIPKGIGAVAEGPRSFTWRADAPAILYWVEAQDGGDPHKDATFRDKLFYLESPFEGRPQEVLLLTLRFGGITWGDGNLAIVDEMWWKDRRIITSVFDPDSGNHEKKILFDRSWENRYDDPGNFATTVNECGKQVLIIDDNKKTLFLIGVGASPEGNRPFVDKFDLGTGATVRLWRSEEPYYEMPILLIDLEKNILLTRRESLKEPPNYFLRCLSDSTLDQLTSFPHPYPQLKNVKKQLLRYKREDGVQLTARLYLPEYYKKDEGKLPVLMWAYPQEYKSADAAGQVKDSPYRFIRIGWWSPLFFLTQGFAILDNPSIAIVGEGDVEPNDTYIEQLVLSAKAAVDEIERMSIADKKRIAIGGHSYGAFMAANLLAHSNLFAAGIARTGAYNRTLTPFGFQSEERTLWEAPETYIKMSPFMYADKIDEPILLIHGEADNNSGTFPIQSERFFAALKGHGARTRLVILPYESHGYRARESILHMLWEMNLWLEKYVKNNESHKESER